MSNGNPKNESIWPLITLMVGIVAIGAVVWDVMLHKQNQALTTRVQKLEEHLIRVEDKEKAADVAAAAARRRARAATQAAGGREEKAPGK